LGTEVAVSESGLWPDIPPSAGLQVTNIGLPLFVYFKLPFANIIEPLSPLGVSAYAKAVGLLEDSDMQYSRYLAEYVLGAFAVNVDASAIEIDSTKGWSVANLDRRLYRGVDIKDLYQAWNPTLRDGSYYEGLNSILRMIEFKCGLSYNTLSDAEFKELTATEIMSSKQRSYGTVREIQKSLENALERLVEVMCILRGLDKNEVETTFEWDDSIIVNEEVEKGLFMQEIAAGLRAPWEYRVKFLGETEAEAKEMIEAIEGNEEEQGLQFDKEMTEEDEEEDKSKRDEESAVKE
jgi:A118 family predicted phage portal protein